MLTCPSCGVENQLGRVFCSGCGAKLDLANMTSENVAESQKKSLFARFWWIIPIVIVVVLAAMTALAFWPKAKPLAEAGSRVEGRGVDRTLSSMERIRKGPKGSKYMTAKEINAYFKFFTPLKTKASVAVMPGRFKVRLVRRGKVNLKFTQWNPTVSYDITCVPVGNTVNIKSATMGHLPMFGPLKKMVIKNIHGELSKNRKWKGLSNISEIKVEKDKIFVQYEKK